MVGKHQGILQEIIDPKEMTTNTSTASEGGVAVREDILRQVAGRMLIEGAALGSRKMWSDKFEELYGDYKKDLEMAIAPKTDLRYKDHARVSNAAIYGKAAHTMIVDDMADYDPLELPNGEKKRVTELCPTCEGSGHVCDCDKKRKAAAEKAEKVAAITTVVKLLLKVIEDGAALYRIENAVSNAEAVMNALGLTPQGVTDEVLRAMDDWYERAREPKLTVKTYPAKFSKDYAAMYETMVKEDTSLLHPPPPPNPAPVEMPSRGQDRAKALLAHPRVGEFTPKEIGFLESLMVWRGQPTVKQLAWLYDLERQLS